MKFKKAILISTLILLMGIGAVSAMEHNSTDEFISVEQNDAISVMNDNNTVISVSGNDSDVLSAEGNNSVISVSGNDSDVLSAEGNNSVISVSGNDSDVLSAENGNTVIAVSNDNDLTGYSPFAKEPQMTQHKTQYKTFCLGKMVFPKKYKKMAIYGYKIPSKKNKKAWKKHIAYQKVYKKQFKLFKKSATKVIKKIAANHWKGIGDIYYKIKFSGNRMIVRYYGDCYRTYNYNPLLNKGWWD